MVLNRSLLLLIALLLPTIAFATTNYVVKKGDNLYDLSRKFGVSVEDIKTLNKLDNNNLGIGNELLLPESNLQSNNKYVVKNGDTTSQIAEKFGVKTKDLINANKLKNDKLQIGQTLNIPYQNNSAPTVVSKNNTVTPTIEEEKSTSSENIKQKTPGTYTVKNGDTLEHIAEKHYVNLTDIRGVNELKNYNLKIVQVPASESKEKITVSPKEENPTQTISINNEYVVKKGDTLGEIAESNGIKTNDLKKANNLKSHNLQIGQKLVIPNSEVEVKVTADNSKEVVSTKTEVKKTSQSLSQNNTNSDLTVSNIYTVQKGDTVYDLSNKFKISKENFKSWNNLDSNNLKIGQDLFLTPNNEIKTASNKSEKKVSKPKYSGSYKVKKGDTLGHIASKFDISVKDLKNGNDLTTNNLSIGKVLKVPALTKPNETVAKSAKTVNRTSSTKYTVKKGDTLGTIAQRHGVSVSKIKTASSLRGDSINIGDVLLIPGTQENSSTSKYTVVTGDTLGEIGNKFGVSVKELKDANNLTKNDLYVGMKLVVPGNPKISNTPTQTAQKPAQQKSTKYVVKRGDTLGLIAKRHGVTVGSLKSANNMRGNNINAGQTISIPGPAEYRVQEKETTYSSNNKNTKESIISMAKQYLGSPYKFGGYSFKTGIDCSGYVKKIFSKFNVQLPRTARDIYYNVGTRVAKSELQTGDLVFFRTYANYPSHVGIYMGNNQFIHASSGARKVAITSLDKKYYTNRYIGAKRIEVAAIFKDEISRK
jgi:peptidoglycan endopeptidase LytF